jgi:hypothetical protein
MNAIYTAQVGYSSHSISAESLDPDSNLICCVIALEEEMADTTCFCFESAELPIASYDDAGCLVFHM